MPDRMDHQMRGSYLALGLEMAVDFVIMYLVIYTMIATLDHFYLNINNVYMTLMMVAPVAMRSMFPSRRLNWIVVTPFGNTPRHRPGSAVHV